jgi:acyl-CoA synthetase (AMP-forming)/AMP-acid ligase II
MRTVVPPVGTLVELMRFASAEFGGRECLRFEGQSLTFADVERQSAQLANVLRDRGVGRGDRVAILLPNCLAWPVAWMAVLRAGAVTVPVNVRYRRSDLGHVLGDSGASAVITDVEHAPQVRELNDATICIVLDAIGDELRRASCTAPDAAVEPGDLANLQYTSGTTGMPKACMLTHDYWIKNSWVLGGVGEVTGDDVVLTAQPFSYIDPLWNFTMCLLLGATLVVLPRFSASGFWPAVRENRATWCYVLGTMPVLLLRQPPDELDTAHRLRMVLCSGINPSLHRELEQRWGVPWREVYGLTEEGGCLAVPLGADDMVGTGVVGRPIGAKQVEVMGADGECADGEVGELVVRGEPLMLGYWHRPDETADVLRDGRLHTGDLGWRDVNGWFHLVGRTKDMIRRGGENISCTEVENVINEHPLVSASAVIAVPDELWGEEAIAYLELSPVVGMASSRSERTESILAHLRARLAPFKVPRYVAFVDELPKTPSERVAKAELRARAAGQGASRYDSIERTWSTPALRGDQ